VRHAAAGIALGDLGEAGGGDLVAEGVELGHRALEGRLNGGVSSWSGR
jgi:hypothetical protein